MSKLLTNTTDLREVLQTLQNKATGGGEQAAPVISVNVSGLITATAGTKSSTHQLAFQPAKTITPSTASQIAVSGGYYTGGNITIAGDSNLVAGNIKSGVSIFGVSGTLEEGNGTGSGELVDYSENEDAMVTKTLSNYTNDRVKFIGSYAFYSCSNLTTVSFPVCTSIGNDAFEYCSNLTSVSFPACSRIGSYAFASCSSLTSVSFPACTISPYVFSRCINLTIVNLSTFTQYSNVGIITTINTGAFSRCNNLSQLYLIGTSICNLAGGSNAFFSTPYTGYSASFSGTPYIYVPSSLITKYQSATNWAYFSSYFSAIEDIDNEDTGGEDTGKISFILNGTQYFAETGMSFADWIESPYNTDGYELLFGFVSNGAPSMLDASTIIENGKEYYA